MIVPDVNVLVYAFHPASPDHDQHRAWLQGLVDGPHDIGMVDAVLTGVARIATHPRVFDPPADLGSTRRFVRSLRAAPTARQLVGNDAVWEVFDELLAGDRGAVGNLVPDAWIAAMTIAHGARLATADRGMARWPGLEIVTPVG